MKFFFAGCLGAEMRGDADACDLPAGRGARWRLAGRQDPAEGQAALGGSGCRHRWGRHAGLLASGAKAVGLARGGLGIRGAHAAKSPSAKPFVLAHPLAWGRTGICFFMGRHAAGFWGISFVLCVRCGFSMRKKKAVAIATAF